ncbi:hypothetical protein [Hymenobacter algoricola]|uniref:DUF2199 domain-containing protein n=1 Tax=Hymenobacter algoricola TaxID=486267 RepID=A0ABP7MUE7_9BACT
MPLPYRPLFYFESEAAILLEIKCLDLPGEQAPGRLYHWLWFDKATQALQAQEFVSMQAGEPEQAREFGQGSLRFTAHRATYAPHDGSPAHHLTAAQPTELPMALRQAIREYLDAQEAASKPGHSPGGAPYW